MGPGPARHQGSSPLARGLPVLRLGGPGRARIIPARAGFTHPTHKTEGNLEDHPRSRGVYQTAIALGRHGAGSSPLARGLLTDCDGQWALAGIIPARAGFTHRVYLHRARPPDHPRSRGVYSWVGAPAPRALGSSPLARGLRSPPRSRILSRRIIPARAGFTTCARRGPGSWKDHPRSRGVYLSSPPCRWRARGSSPLARGLPGGGVEERASLRIIPARAGFTTVYFLI